MILKQLFREVRHRQRAEMNNINLVGDRGWQLLLDVYNSAACGGLSWGKIDSVILGGLRTKPIYPHFGIILMKVTSSFYSNMDFALTTRIGIIRKKEIA